MCHVVAVPELDVLGVGGDVEHARMPNCKVGGIGEEGGIAIDGRPD